jgi:hypothetical protein
VGCILKGCCKSQRASRRFAIVNPRISISGHNIVEGCSPSSFPPSPPHKNERGMSTPSEWVGLT